MILPRIRTLVAATIAALFTATVAVAQADARVEAFRSACIDDRQDYDALIRGATDGGWIVAEPGDNAELDALLEVSAEGLAEEDVPAWLAAFRKTVDGGDFYLVLTRLAGEPFDLVGCYVYDFEADEPIERRIISDWLGQFPSDSIDEPGVITADTWDVPDRYPGTFDIYSAYLPEGGAASTFTGFSGVLIKITSVDPKDK